MIREVVIDTETTGIDPESGDRICEIGCVEMIDHVRTGREYHAYINPQCPMQEEAFNAHGLDNDFLADKPTFDQVVDDFLAFVGDAALVVHNAEFDLRFLDAELKRLEQPPIDRSRAIDTLSTARRRFPGKNNSLDALCRRFQIDPDDDNLHGALLDAQLLADVYLELIGESKSEQEPQKQTLPPLHADAGVRIILSDGRLTSEGNRRRKISQSKLEHLREMLDRLYPEKQPPKYPGNQEPVDIDPEDLELLKSLVDSAIAVHRSPKIPRSVMEVLRTLANSLEEHQELLEQLEKAGFRVSGLVGAIATVVITIQALIGF